MPISGRDLFHYLIFLAKGQYFKTTGEIFSPADQVVQIRFVNKKVLASLESNYAVHLGSNPFEDLVRNPNSESLCGGECVIWSRESEFLFILHRYVGVIAKVLPYSRKNYRHARRLERQILRDFR